MYLISSYQVQNQVLYDYPTVLFFVCVCVSFTLNTNQNIACSFCFSFISKATIKLVKKAVSRSANLCYHYNMSDMEYFESKEDSLMCLLATIRGG